MALLSSDNLGASLENFHEDRVPSLNSRTGSVGTFAWGSELVTSLAGDGVERAGETAGFSGSGEACGNIRQIRLGWECERGEWCCVNKE